MRQKWRMQRRGQCYGQRYGFHWPMQTGAKLNVFVNLRRRSKSDLRPSAHRYRSWLRLLRSKALLTSFRNQFGSWLQAHQRMARRIPSPSKACCTSGRSSAVMSKRSVRHPRSSPQRTRTSQASAFHQKDTFGWGVEKSLLPHWEHTSAIRGFG